LNKPSPKEITWAEAFALLEKKLKETPQKKQGIIYSPNLTNEELELLVYLALNLIKTDKLDTLMSCSHPFYSLIREAVAPLSIIKERAEVVFLLRNNPQQANPLLKTYLNYALRQRKINIIYAYPTEINFLTRGWKLAPLSPKPLNLVYLPYRELLAVAGILKSLLKYTEDKEEKILNLQEHLKTNFSWEFIENKSGVKKDELEDVANILVKNEKIALVIGASYGLLSDEENLAYAIYYLVYILKKVLKKEVNLFYLTDKPNLWGMIEAGASPYSLKEGSIKRLRMNVYQILNAGVKGELELLYIIGENISNYPGVIRLMEELKSKVEFIVYQGSFQNPTSAIAHLILPTTQFLETEGTFLDYSIQPVKFNSCVLSNSGRMSNESIFRELIRRYGGQVAEKEDKREYSEELDLLFSFRDTFVCEADNFYPFYLFPGPYLFFSDSPWEKNFSLVEKLIASPFFEVSKEIESKLKIKERTKVKLISPFGEISNIELRYSNDIPPHIVYLPYYFGASQLLSLPSLDFSSLPLFYGNKVRIST
jgi:predicted molibdopterin-dependent oxidoreductase YjgC